MGDRSWCLAIDVRRGKRREGNPVGGACQNCVLRVAKHGRRQACTAVCVPALNLHDWKELWKTTAFNGNINENSSIVPSTSKCSSFPYNFPSMPIQSDPTHGNVPTFNPPTAASGKSPPRPAGVSKLSPMPPFTPVICFIIGLPSLTSLSSILKMR